MYDRTAQPREFQPGDRVLVLVPTVECKFLATWQGTYKVIEKVGEVNYKIRQPGKRKAEQIYHVNLLKKMAGQRDIVYWLFPKGAKRIRPGSSAFWLRTFPSPVPYRPCGQA